MSAVGAPSVQITGGGGSSGGLTDAELRADPVPVEGNVIVLNFPSTQAVTGAFWQSVQPVSGTFWPATQPVSGTFWQSTQPVSGPLTDAQLRATALPVSGTFWQSTQPVSGTFWQATQPVSGPVTDAQMRATPVAVSGPVTDAQLMASPVPVADRPSTLGVTAVGAAGAAVTLTLPAAGTGLFHYITQVRIEMYNTAARTGGATPVTVTSTNLPGTPAWTFPSAGAVGTIIEQEQLLAGNALRSSAANVPTTIVGPATTSVIWRLLVFYYTGT